MMIKRIWPSLGHSIPEPARMFRDIGRLFDAVYGEHRSEYAPGVFPALNITRDEDRFFVRAELPGMSADDLMISVERNKLSLAGSRTVASGSLATSAGRSPCRPRSTPRRSRLVSTRGS